MINVKGGAVEFRNPYNKAKEFKIILSNQNFICNQKNPLKIESKKSVQLQLSYKEINQV